MTASATRVAARFQIRKAAYRAASEIHASGVRTASSHEITGETLATFGEAFWLQAMTGSRAMRRQARLGGLRAMAKRLKQLGEIFKKAPRLWEDFKRLVGLQNGFFAVRDRAIELGLVTDRKAAKQLQADAAKKVEEGSDKSMGKSANTGKQAAEQEAAKGSSMAQAMMAAGAATMGR